MIGDDWHEVNSFVELLVALGAAILVLFLIALLGAWIL